MTARSRPPETGGEVPVSRTRENVGRSPGETPVSPGTCGARILVVDDHAEVVEFLVESLREAGYLADGETSAPNAVPRILTGNYDLVVSDIEMPGLRGLDLLAAVHREKPDQLVLLITAFGSVQLAVEAVRAGACDFVTKPFPIEELFRAIERAMRERTMRREIVRLRRSIGAVPADGLVARSPAMRRVVELVERAARSESPVLLTGESGVGKGTLARLLHARSPRSSGPFVQVNCAAIPAGLAESELFGVRRGAFTDAREDRDGLFVRAHRGTLFLDEIGELPLDVQPKLLHALESGRVRALGASAERPADVRVVAATNRDLAEAVRERAFRPDLLFRLNVITLPVPPLRERPEDVDGLVDAFVARLSARAGRPIVGIAEDAVAWLRSRPWPGNVRELGNVLERAVALGEHDTITLEDVAGGEARPEGWRTLEEAAAAGRPLEDVERAYIRRVIEACGGNMAQAARVLQIDRRTLYRRLE